MNNRKKLLKISGIFLIIFLSIVFIFTMLAIGVTMQTQTNIFIGRSFEKDAFSQTDVKSLEAIYQLSFPNGTIIDNLQVDIDNHRETRMTLWLTIELPEEDQDDFIAAWYQQNNYYNSLSRQQQQEKLSKDMQSKTFHMELYMREGYPNFEECKKLIQPEISKKKACVILLCIFGMVGVILSILLVTKFMIKN